MMSKIPLLAMMLLLLLMAACGPDVPQECSIEIGESGRTYSYNASLLRGELGALASGPASSFSRATGGPCSFQVYNNRGFEGRSVTLGSGLTGRIRAGLDGVENRDGGGGQTWRIRSLIMQCVSTWCRLRIGGNGIRMEYYDGRYSQIPAMGRISWFQGGDCTARIWSTVSFGDRDPNNRFKSLHPSGPRSESYDPGFRARSLVISNQAAGCPGFTNDQGRCLPQTQLPGSIDDVGSLAEDQDRDGLVDALENELATAFRPIYVNHSTENATRVDVYTTVTGEQVIEPVTVFQVHPVRDGEIIIRFMRLWLWDVYDSLFCGGHKGDSQRHAIYLRTAPSSDTSRHNSFWYVYRTSGGIKSDLKWEMGDGSIRGASFERLPGDSRNVPANHLVIYFTKGKHHEYADQGWSGQTDKECSGFLGLGSINAYINGRGELHDPPLPKRAAILRSPPGAGDPFGFTNVGSRDFPHFNDLEPYGFPEETFWDGGDFYDAAPAARGFE